MTQTQDEIDRLFVEAEAVGGDVEEFARDCLNHYRKESAEVVAWHREEGRARAFAGEDAGPVREEAERRLEAARVRLRDRLAALLEWGRRSQG